MEKALKTLEVLAPIMELAPKKDSGEGRTHLLRAEQVIESKTDTVVTGCNFCYGMMNQGIGPLTPAGQETIKVKDVADIVAENLS